MTIKDWLEMQAKEFFSEEAENEEYDDLDDLDDSYCCHGGSCRKIWKKISKVLTAYTVIGLCVAFFVSLCVFVNFCFDMLLYVIVPFGALPTPPWKRIMFRVVTGMLTFSLGFNSVFILSLFWKVIQPFYKENHCHYCCIKFVFLIIDLISAGIWSGVTSTSFVHRLFLFTFFKALAILGVGSLSLLFFIYTKRYTKFFHGCKCTIWTLITFGFGLFFLFSMYFCPIVYALIGASGGPCSIAFLLPYFSYLFIFFLYNRGRREENKGFLLQFKVVVLMIVAVSIVGSVFIKVDYHCASKGCQLGLPSNTGLKRRSLEDDLRIPGYQMCTKKWTGDLKITDMVFFADLAYKIADKDQDDLTMIMKEYFPNHRWYFEYINKGRPSFFHVRDTSWSRYPTINLIGIRGTVDSRDWVENGKIWNEVLIFQALISFLPYSSLIPLSTVAAYIECASFLDSIYEYTDKTYIEVLENYLKKSDVQEKRRNEQFYLVGHSLGGGLAKIVGSRLKIQAVAISSPGEMYNHAKYGYSLADLQQYTTTFGSRDDIISWLDKPGGLVQKVRKEGASGVDFFKAHSIKDTFCDIEKKCHITTKIPCD